jgi:hypothetical protein
MCSANFRATLYPTYKRNAGHCVCLQGKKEKTHRPLTLFRMLRGVLCCIVLVLTTLVPLLFLAPPAFIFLRLLSVQWSRRATSFFLAGWLSLWPFFFEKINQTKVQNSRAWHCTAHFVPFMMCSVERMTLTSDCR